MAITQFGKRVQTQSDKEIYFISDYRELDIKKVVISDGLILDYADKEACFSFLKLIRSSFIESIYLVPVFILSLNDDVDEFTLALSDGVLRSLSEETFEGNFNVIDQRIRQLQTSDTNDLVIITGITEKVKEEVDRLVGEVSEPLKQVEIESRVVDESLVDEIVRKLSLDVELPSLNVGANSSGLNLTTSVMDLIDYQTLLSAIPSATVTASVNVTDSDSISNLLASPRIVTTSGKEARIFASSGQKRSILLSI